MRIAISSRYYQDDFPAGLSLDQKIEVFADRVLNWQLLPAQEMADKIPHSGFAVLHIVMSYFESIAKFQDGYTGKGLSKKYFKKGFEEVFPLSEKIGFAEADKLLDEMYDQIRCGLYHAGMTGRGIIITGGIDVVLRIEGDKAGNYSIFLNPHQIVNPLKDDLTIYLRKLRIPTNQELRTKFEHRFDWLEAGEQAEKNTPPDED